MDTKSPSKKKNNEYNRFEEEMYPEPLTYEERNSMGNAFSDYQ